MTEDTETKIIWCFGEHSNYAHAYPGEAGVKAGVTICGTKCVPTIKLTHWDLSRKEIADISCPTCKKRLMFKENYELLDKDKAKL